MKKIVIGIICFLLIAAAGGGGYYFLSQKKSSALLNEFAKGGKYSSLGWEIEVPSFQSDQIKGGGAPYADFGDQKVSISFAGKKVTELQHGRLIVNSKKEKSVSLIFDQVTQGKVIYSGLAFDLTVPQSLRAIHVAKIQTKPAEVNTQMVSSRGRSTITLEGLDLNVSEYQEFIPDQINLNLSSIQIDQQTSRGQEQVLFKNLKTQINSHANGEIRDWTYQVDMEGISGKIEGNKITSHPLHVEFSGSMNNIKIAEIQVFGEKIKKEFNKDAIASLVGELLEIANPIPTKFAMQWDGLEVVDSQNNKRVFVSPISINQESKEEGAGFTSTGEGKVDQVIVDGRKLKLGMKNLSFKGLATYKGKTIKDFYRSYYGNLKNLFTTLNWKNTPSAPMIGSFYLDAFSRYPSSADVEFKIENLEINPGTPLEGQYKNIFLKAKMHDQGFEYLIGTNMNQKFKGSLQEVKDAQIEFKVAGEYPWGYIQEQINKLDKTNEEQMKLFVFDLLKHRYGYFMGLKADAGNLGFIIDTGLHAKVDMNQMTLTDEEKFFGEKLVQKIGAHLVDHGEVSYSFKIAKLSSLKAIMEKVKQGSSSTLILLGDYVKMDEAKDTLEMDYLYKEGQSLLNGLPNENLGKIIEQLKYKLLPFSRPVIPPSPPTP